MKAKHCDNPKCEGTNCVEARAAAKLEDVVVIQNTGPPPSPPVSLRRRALALYRPPFRYEEGYIWDGKGEMVADSHIESDIGPRVRGWGRMRYEPGSEDLYKEMGEIIAEALTAFWRNK